MPKYDSYSRQDIAKQIFGMFIMNIVKAKIHFGKRHVFIVVELNEEVDAENVAEATIKDMSHGYQELVNVPMQKF